MSFDRTQIETVVLATSLFVLLATVGAIALEPPVDTATPTELALVDSQGTASGYPTTLGVGERGDTVVQVTNNADDVRTYTLVVTYDGERLSRGTIRVSAESHRRFPVSFTADGPPGRKEFAVRLWTGDGTEGPPDRTVRIWVTVEASGSAG